MPDFEVSDDYFSNHNPLAVDEDAAQELRKKHGVVLHWDNPHFRAHYGRRHHKPVLKTDEIFSDVKKAIALEDFDIEESEDGKIHCGDLVLAQLPAKVADFRDRQRTARANLRSARLSQGANLNEELSRAQHVPGMDAVSVGEATVKVSQPFIGADIAEATRRGGRGGKRRG